MNRARGRAASIAILTSIPMMAQGVAGRAVRDTIYLSEYDASRLPEVMFAAAALSLVAALGVGRLMPRWGPRRAGVFLAVLNGAMFVSEAALLDVIPGVVAVITYLHVGLFGALVASAFASVLNERFDPHHAKTVVSRVGTGYALGSVLGGAAAVVLSGSSELEVALYSLGGISALVAVGIWSVGGSAQSRRPVDTEARSGLETIRADSYLRRVALTVMLLGGGGVFISYSMKAEAERRLGDPSSLLSFFAAYYMATALLTFVTQASATKPLLQRIGLARTMAVLPVAVALSAALGAVWTRLWTTTLTRGLQDVLSSSLFRSGYELLYTPVPALDKRRTKALIDIACNRIGYGIGSLVVMAIVAVAATVEIATSWILGLAVIVASVSVFMIRRLHAGYVNELATSLRDGSVVLQPDEIVDATTLSTFAGSVATLDRERLLQDIEALRRSRDPRLAAQRATWTRQLSDLLADEPQRVLSVLADESLSPHFAAHIIDLLGVDVYTRPAHHALERMAPRITGQLVDAMLCGENPPTVRRRIPRLLRRSEDPIAVRGLLEGLRDEELDVRYRCAHALAAMKRAKADIDLPREVIMEAVVREVGVSQEQLRHQELREERSSDIESEEDLLPEAREDRGLRHVFTLLGLAFDFDAMVLSLRALSSDDENLRGTALEYLYNVLPAEVREPLWPRLTEHREHLQSPSAPSSAEELLRSMRLRLLDREHS